MGRRSGAARRRARKVNAILAERDGLLHRMRDGGDIIDGALSALRAVSSLACEQRGDLHLVAGGDLSMLLALIEDEFLVGRAVQNGDEAFDT